jgi:hypothetical protein
MTAMISSCLILVRGRTPPFESDSLAPPNGERAGVRGKHLKTKRLFTSIGNGGKEEKPNGATIYNLNFSRPAHVYP